MPTQKRFYISLSVILLTFSGMVAASTEEVIVPEDVVFPGAVKDEALSKQMTDAANDFPALSKSRARELELRISAYRSDASYRDVLKFYKEIGKKSPSIKRRDKLKIKLPDGEYYTEDYYILDDAEDLGMSKLWVNVKTHYLKNFITLKDIEDVRLIIVYERPGLPDDRGGKKDK